MLQSQAPVSRRADVFVCGIQYSCVQIRLISLVLRCMQNYLASLIQCGAEIEQLNPASEKYQVVKTAGAVSMLSMLF